VPSSHLSPGLAPQIGQRRAKANFCFDLIPHDAAISANNLFNCAQYSRENRTTIEGMK
jgi:hypothetical protein